MKNKWEKRSFAALMGLFVLAIAFELNGSSVGMWNRYVPNSREVSPVLGTPRPFRSDEWAVFTPMTLAQDHAKPSYPYFNAIPRATATDMYSVYAQPVRHPLLAFRPFLAGFVLFGFERGLAFFWYGRWLALFLAMYGLFGIMTDRNKPLSAIASFLVVFSPAVQWWGAINALAEILVFGALFAICLDSFMKGGSFRERWLSVLGMGYSGTCYAMALYPAAMVPFAYVFASICIWIVWRRAKGFRAGSGLLLSAFFAAVVAASFLAWYLRLSAESFRIVSGTAYPGRRFDCGGGFLKGLGWSFGGLFFPWTSPVVEDGNVFSRAMFPDFFPLGLALASIVVFRRGIRDLLVFCLLAVSAAIGVYCIAGYPEWFAKATLFSRSTPPRAFVAFSFVQFLLAVSCAAMMRPSPSRRMALVAALSVSLLGTVAARLAYPNYLSDARLFVVWCVAFSGCFLFLRFSEQRPVAGIFFVLLGVLSGGTVNPVQRGDAGILDSDLARAIRATVEKDSGSWVVEGESFPMNQYPLLVGAPTVNAGNLYPALDRWACLDPPGKAKRTWNRYAAGIRVDLDPVSETAIDLTGFDTFRVKCSPDVIQTLGVRHVLSRRDLEALSGERVRFVPEAKASGWTVYAVEKGVTGE